MAGIRYVILALALASAALAGCAQIEELFSPGPTFEVVFDADPHLRLEEVRSKGVVIGRILEKGLSPEGFALVKIRIEKKYKEMMLQNVVFVSMDGALEYERSGGQGVSLEPGARIVGFADQGAYLSFQAQSLLMDWSGALLDRLRQMLKPRPGAAPAPPKQGQEL